jgi:hypothetical protein
MKKFLIALMFLASTLMFAQDGRTKVNFYNQTDSTLRFILYGNPACTGDVIPGGFCTEAVAPGTYTASATDGQRSSGGQTFTIAYGETYTYRVYVQNTALDFAPGLKLVANLDYHNGFIVDSPVTLKTDGPMAGTTHENKPFTETLYAASLANDDTYMVGVSEYTFQVTNDDLGRGIEGFRNSIGGTVDSSNATTVSGYPATIALISATQGGRPMHFALLITYRGNKAYMFVFGTFIDTQSTDVDAVKRFFNSAALN